MAEEVSMYTEQQAKREAFYLACKLFGTILGLVAFLWLLSEICKAEPPLGTVYLSRNLDERLNDSPGYWNHVAIYVGQDALVESQIGVGVVRTSLADYSKRAYQVGVLYPRDKAVGERAAAVASSYVGRPYRRLSSFAPNLVPPIVPAILHGTPYGMNCVSTVGDAYAAALGGRFWNLRRPDQFCYLPQVLINQPPGGVR